MDGESLKKLRSAIGVTQGEIGELLFANAQQISRLELEKPPKHPTRRRKGSPRRFSAQFRDLIYGRLAVAVERHGKTAWPSAELPTLDRIAVILLLSSDNLEAVLVATGVQPRRRVRLLARPFRFRC